MTPRQGAPPVDTYLPLKPVVFQVLLTLADGDRHGYAIVQDIAQRNVRPHAARTRESLSFAQGDAPSGA